MIERPQASPRIEPPRGRADGAAILAAPAGEAVRAGRLALVTEAMAVALGPRRFQAAASALATELAVRLACERVSIGFIEGERLRLVALSNNARFSDKQRLIRRIEAAMEAALDRETTIHYPPPESQAMCPAHAQLAREDGMSGVLTVPMHRGNRLVGAIGFERGPGTPPFDAETAALCEQLVALAGPILDLRHGEDRPVRAVLRDALHARLQMLFGPGHLVVKCAASLAALVLLLLVLVPGTFRVSADAVLEGRIERVVAAPQKGFLQSVHARPGDMVAAGAVLATLDDRDLRLEELKWSAKEEQVSKEFRAALAERERAKIGILSAQLDQAVAQRAIVEKQLARLNLQAPFAGVVVSGDFTRELGTPLERGQVLFKVAPLEDYRVILKVSEGDVADLREGQRGRLTLAAAPGEPLRLMVERITPVATAEASANYFRVEARLDNPPPFLRPGMQGIARVDIGSRQLIWIWTRSLVNWLRLKWWAWLP